MDNMMFKISRLMSFVSFICVAVSFYLIFFVKENFTIKELLLVLFLSLIYVCPLLIFNWIYFRKVTLWINDYEV